MAQQNSALSQDQKIGLIFFSLFLIFVAAGIIVKRVFDHPELMMMFHGPAAIFLGIAGHKIPEKLKARYQQDCERFKP